MSAKQWRIICSCQSHEGWSFKASSLAQRNLVRAKKYCGTFLVGVPVAFYASGAPGLPTTSVTAQKAVARKVPVRAVAAEARPEAPKSWPALKLVTTQVREEFLKPQRNVRSLSLELVNEEFFRTEIPYGAIIYREAVRNNLSPDLVAAVVRTESDFRPGLISHRNAHGLMQVLPATGALMGVTDLLNPEQNVRAGAKYLRYLNRRFKGDLRLVLAAYNAGEGNVSKYRGVPPFPETQQYLKRVASSRHRYQKRMQQRMTYALRTLDAETRRTQLFAQRIESVQN